MENYPVPVFNGLNDLNALKLRLPMTSLFKSFKRPSYSTISPGNNLLSEVPHLRRHRTHRVDHGLPHFVFAGAALPRPTEVELGTVFVSDSQIHGELDELGRLSI